VSRMKMPACVAVAADMAGPHTPLAAGVMFDAVLVDAPCTGTGVIRRHPELRYRLTLSDLDRQVETQARLLERCAGLVKPGGTMVYAVCSLEPEEGIEQVRRFLARHDGFEVADPTPYLPPPARGLVTRRESWPFLETLPHRDDLDGFFAARMERHQ
ncbi:MAG: hypothetical protein ACE5HU_07110, partial [Acidobacteriota bacterium]